MGLIQIVERLVGGSINAYDALNYGGPGMLYARLRRSNPDAGSLPGIEVEWPSERCHPLDFSKREEPFVSLVIPAEGNWRYTFNAFKGVLKHSIGRHPYEVIAVDNATSDETAEMLQKMIGIKTVRQPKREDFAVCCNKGAELARGKYLVFLDDRAYVQPGWLEALLETFDSGQGIVAVGARLLYSDGSIVSSGGLPQSDMIAGDDEGGDFRAPEHSYARKAALCNPRCMMIVKDQFIDLGGFRGPGDADPNPDGFWSRVKMEKKEVYLQPAARVVLLDRVSTAAHTVSTPRQAGGQVRHRAGNAETVSGHSRAKHVLVVEKRMIVPDRDSGSFRMLNMLKILVSFGWKVTFAPIDMKYVTPYTPALQREGIEALYRPYTGSLKSHLMAQGRRYDIVILSRADVANFYMAAARKFCPDAKLVFDTVDLHFLREKRRGAVEKNRLIIKGGEIRKRQELRLIRAADLTLVVSPYEKEVIGGLAPEAHVMVVSNIHEASVECPPFEGREGVMFLGNFDHTPNVDAACFFIKEIWPIIRRRRNGLRLSIVGNNPPARIAKLKAADVAVVGYVKDLSGLLGRMRVSVAPLRYGSGVKGKINMSMSHGVPVVATSAAVEGMNIDNEGDAIVADDPEAFADAVIRVHDDQNLWEKLSDRSREHVNTFFSADVAKRQLKAVLDLVNPFSRTG